MVDILGCKEKHGGEFSIFSFCFIYISDFLLKKQSLPEIPMGAKKDKEATKPDSV